LVYSNSILYSISNSNSSISINRRLGENDRMAKQVLWRTRIVLHGLLFGTHHKVRKYTLLILLCFGLAGVLIDLDHLVSPIFKSSRPLHIPYLIAVWIVCIGYCAHVYRRIHKTSIGNKDA